MEASALHRIISVKANGVTGYCHAKTCPTQWFSLRMETGCNQNPYPVRFPLVPLDQCPSNFAWLITEQPDLMKNKKQVCPTLSTSSTLRSKGFTRYKHNALVRATVDVVPATFEATEFVSFFVGLSMKSKFCL